MMAGGCSFSLQTPTQGRRDFVSKVSEILVSSSNTNIFPSVVKDELLVDNAASSISWDGPPWSKSRYSTSTLQSAKSNYAPPQGSPTVYPDWLDGYQSIIYKFVSATFPQGRQILSLQIAGAGLGTCMSLPNVGYNPPTPHALHYIKQCNDDTPSKNHCTAYEDWAYNIPRVFEAFWPQAKVVSVRTSNPTTGHLSPRCSVSGDGCQSDTNPELHSPASRIELEFVGPTRQGGLLAQYSDVTLLSSRCEQIDDDACLITKCFSQYNANQDLQTFYKEIRSLRRISDSDGTRVDGRLQVQAFLPIDVVSSRVVQSNYDDTKAVALYEYRISMKGIDFNDAASL